MPSIVLGIVVLALLAIHIWLGNPEDSTKKRVLKTVGAVALSIACSLIFAYIAPIVPTVTELLTEASVSESLIEVEEENDTSSQQNLEDKTAEYTGITSFISILILEDGDVREYTYNADTSGTYYFYAETSSNVDVWLEIDDKGGNILYRSINEICADLEGGNTYNIIVEYKNGACGGIIGIVEPSEIKELSADSSVTGAIISEYTSDRYYFTPSQTRLYTLKLNVSKEKHLVVRISDYKGNSLNYGTDEVSLVLDSFDTYIVSVEYVDDLCAYTLTVE